MLVQKGRGGGFAVLIGAASKYKNLVGASVSDAWVTMNIGRQSCGCSWVDIHFIRCCLELVLSFRKSHRARWAWVLVA